MNIKTFCFCCDIVLLSTLGNIIEPVLKISLIWCDKFNNNLKYIYCTGYGLRPIRPSAEHSQESKLGPNLIVRPYRFWVCGRQAHVRPFMVCSGLRIPRTTYLPSGSVLPWGVLLPTNLLEAEISSKATTTVSNKIYSMSGIITSDPTHTSETRM